MEDEKVLHTSDTRIGSNRNGQNYLIICHFCRKPGHVKKNCYSRLNQLKKSEEPNDTVGVAFNVFGADIGTEEVLLDSGASTHMANNKENFSSYAPVENLFVTAAGGANLKVHKIGVYVLNSKSSLLKIYYTPQLIKSLISCEYARSSWVFSIFRKWKWSDN